MASKKGNLPPPSPPEQSAGFSQAQRDISNPKGPYKEPHSPSLGINFWQKILREIPVIQRAPYSFFSMSLIFAALAVGGLVWFKVLVPNFIAMNLSSQVDTLKTQLDVYERQLKGATPAEAQAEIENLRTKVDQLSTDLKARRWEPLNDDVVKAIAEALKAVPPRNAAVNFLDVDSRPLVQSFKSIFETAGWPMPYEPDVVFGWHKDGIWIGPIDDDNERIKKIIEEKTGMKLNFYLDRRQFGAPKEVNILIGYKPR